MILDLREVFSSKTKAVDIDTTVDMSDYDVYGVQPIALPVSVKGDVKNSADVVTLNVTVEFIYSAPCDRCATETQKQLGMSFSHVLVSSLAGDDEEEFIVVENMELDLDDVVKTDIILNLPTKFLCSEDCKGVCPGCGRSLNTDECVCEKEVDPRLAKLKELLK
ncbi:MAG: DUF177 domain-containing protein [Clostridia bacterium]|nr:DUF177 domain-containing protein [Clostridia bacterium]